MKKIAVYGSLRKGMYNHALLHKDGAQYVKTEIFEIPFKMIPYSSYPALIPDDKNNKIEMEIYDVDDNVYRMIEYLEGYPTFYDKASVTDNEETIEFYILPDKNKRLQTEYQDQPSIQDWVSYFNKNIKHAL